MTLRNFYEDVKFYDFYHFHSFLVLPFSLKLPMITCFKHKLYSKSDLQENTLETCNYMQFGGEYTHQKRVKIIKIVEFFILEEIPEGLKKL